MAQLAPYPRGPGGTTLPAQWRQKFLKTYAESGVRWWSADKAGISEATVSRHEAADPEFAVEVDAARQRFADSLEMNMTKLAVKSKNVVANIVLLKKHRPHDYVERRQELSLHVHTQVSAYDGRALLAKMLAQATDATRDDIGAHLLHTPSQVGEMQQAHDGGSVGQNPSLDASEGEATS